MSDIVLHIDGLRSFSATPICRICHEEEEEEESLEAPCACSGTVKFAHSDCIQRWCNEKGDTTCEICLQKFESGYICPPPKKTQLCDATTVTISGSLEVPGNEQEPENTEEDTVEYASSADRSASCCRSVALIFTALLLIRHLAAVLTGEVEAYPFSLLTVLIAKASGILLPMYILTRIVAALHANIRHRSVSGYMIDSNHEEGSTQAST